MMEHAQKKYESSGNVFGDSDFELQHALLNGEQGVEQDLFNEKMLANKREKLKSSSSSEDLYGIMELGQDIDHAAIFERNMKQLEDE